MKLSPTDWSKLVALALLLLVPFGVATWTLGVELHESNERALRTQLRTPARLLASALGHDAGGAAQVDAMRQSLEQDGVRVEILAAGDGSRAGGDDSRPAPETGNANDGGRQRVSASAETADGRVVRLSRPAVVIVPGAARMIPAALFVLATVVILALLAAATVLSSLRRRVVQRLLRGVRDLSTGNLSADVRIDGSDDLAKLAGSVDAVRRRLAGQVKTIDQQRHTLDSLVRQLREGLVVLRDDNRVRLINPAAVRLLSVPGEPQEYVGRPVHRCLSSEAMRELSLFPGEANTESPRQCRIRIDARDGERTLLADIWPVELPEGDETPRARVLVLTDISRLEQAMKVRTDFVANASHELRTPLSTIRAAIETLLSIDLRDEADQAGRFLQTIERHTTRLEELVTDLLNLSRLESSQARFEAEPLQIVGEVEALRARHAAKIQRASLHWGTQIEPAGEARLLANANLLRLVLDNLVDNAVKFTPAGGSVTLSVARNNGHVSFAVADTGRGIAPEEQPRVFERFYQVGRDRSGPARGTGLGLSIVRHAVSVMGGRVSLESELGRGTTVTVDIPQSVQQPDPGGAGYQPAVSGETLEPP